MLLQINISWLDYLMGILMIIWVRHFRGVIIELNFSFGLTTLHKNDVDTINQKKSLIGDEFWLCNI